MVGRGAEFAESGVREELRYVSLEVRGEDACAVTFEIAKSATEGGGVGHEGIFLSRWWIRFGRDGREDLRGGGGVCFVCK